MPASYPSRFPGFVRAEPLEVWRAETTVGEASPRSSHPEPQEDAEGRTPSLALGAAGELAPGTTIEVRTQAAGYIGAAGYVWKRTTLAGSSVSEDYRGCDVPNGLAGHNSGGWASGTAVRRYPVGLTYPDGSQVVVAAAKTIAAGTVYTVERKTLNLTTGNFSTASDIATGLSNTAPPYPCLVYIPEEGLTLCPYWRIDDDADEAQVVILVSRDQGDTWETWAQDVLEDAISTHASTGYTPGRLRAAYGNGQIVLFAELTYNSGTGINSRLFQWASSDLGRSFVNIADATDADVARARPDVVFIGGKFYLGFLYYDSGTGFVIMDLYELGSAWEKFTEATNLDAMAGIALGSATTSPTVITGGECCIVRQYDRLLFYVQAFGGGVSVKTPTVYSFDPSDPNAPTSLGNYLGVWFNDGQATPTEYPINFQGVEWRGQIHIFCQIVSDSGDFDDQWTRLELGGYSSRTMPPTNNTWAENARASWDMVTIASSDPDAQDWTTGAAAGTVSRTADVGWARVTTTAGNAHYWQSADAPDQDDLIIVSGRVRTSSGSVLARDVMIGVRGATNLVAGYRSELWFSSTQIRLKDGVTTTIATVSADVAGGVEVLIVQKAAAVRAYYRELGADNQDRLWSAIGSSNALTDDTGVGGGGEIEFGNRTTTGVVADYLPIRLQIQSVGEAAFTNPDQLWPAVYTASPRYVGDALSILAAAGPAATGDSYLVRGDAMFPARAALPRGDELSALDIRGGQQPSPRPDEGWRSTATSGRLAYRPPGGYATAIERGVFVCHIERPNWATASVQKYSGGAWSSLGTVDTRGLAVSLPYLRYGARLVIDPGGSFPGSPPYFLDGELAGGYVRLSATKIRPIGGNRGGYWSTTRYGPRPTIDMDPASIDGTEPASGTLDVWYPRVTFVAYLAAAAVNGFALNWSSAVVNYEGYIRAGLVFIGEGWLTSTPADWGLERGLTPSTILDTLQTGQRLSRVLAPGRSRLSLPFVTPLPRNATGTNRIVCYPSSTAGVAPFATVGDDADTLRGLIDDSQGAHQLVCYVPGFVAGTPDTYSLVGDRAGMVGRIVSEEWTQVLQSGNETTPAYRGVVIEHEQEL